jgi:hypothetical protein
VELVLKVLVDNRQDTSHGPCLLDFLFIQFILIHFNNPQSAEVLPALVPRVCAGLIELTPGR